MSPSSLLLSGKAMSSLPIPSGLLPLFNFESPLLYPPPLPPCAATTVYALPPFLPSLCLRFRFVFFAFFDNEKCSTRFSLLIYVLARFSYTLALICCCCCCCCCTFLFFCAFSVWVAPLIQFHLSWLHLQLFSMHRCAI